MTTTHSDARTFPKTREKCPFDPPADFMAWSEDAALAQVTLWNERTAWLAVRYDEVEQVLSDSRFSASPERGLPPLSERDIASPANRTFLRMDDPEHQRLRQMIMKEFRVKHVEARRPQVEGFVNKFIDDMKAKGTTADLVQEFALPLPSVVIADLLGVPYEDHDVFQRCTGVMMNLSSPSEAIHAAGAELRGYLENLVEAKTAQPEDDLVSRLVTTYVARGAITPQDAVNMCMLLLIGGHETTANMISLGTIALLEHPDQAVILRDADDPRAVSTAVEELLRFLSVIANGPVRVAMEDIRVGDQLVRAGEGVILNIPAANRDRRVFDSPNELDLTRQDNRHLAFGAGVHRCIGLTLARLELQVALPALLRRLPDLRLLKPAPEIDYRHQSLIFGALELPVAWSE